MGLNRIARGWQTPAFACQGEDTMFSDADADDDDSDQVISVLITRKHGAAMYDRLRPLLQNLLALRNTSRSRGWHQNT